ncbi:MAG: energy-coupling factor transporter transmembrane protein EcfT [Erysipelotrichales bacterium]|nr:energy-coupling factor transporter transmembrane protein EcfT [Erysipelotrichales bacterium]
MKLKMFSYNEENTFVHRLSGVTKLLCFLILSFVVMYTYDIRIMLLIGAFSIYLFKLSRISFKQVRFLVMYLLFFVALNGVITYFFEPTHGNMLYGTYHELFRFNDIYVVTQEQLFYQVSKMVKYMCVIPMGLIFFCTTNPSEFASSLNHAKVPYKGAYAVSLTLRYFPDIARQFTDISNAQQARGIDMSAKAKVMTRLKNTLMVISPLIFSALDRVDMISNAMDLRGFGKYPKRTWYTYRKLGKEDALAFVVCLSFVALALYMAIFVTNGRFYNPFI